MDGEQLSKIQLMRVVKEYGYDVRDEIIYDVECLCVITPNPHLFLFQMGKYDPTLEHLVKKPIFIIDWFEESAVCFPMKSFTF